MYNRKPISRITCGPVAICGPPTEKHLSIIVKSGVVVVRSGTLDTERFDPLPFIDLRSRSFLGGNLTFVNIRGK